MHPTLSELFIDLHDSSGPKVISYGNELNLSETQARILTCLNFALEGRVVTALAHLERRDVRVLECGDKCVYFVAQCLVDLAQNICCCEDYEENRTCSHLICLMILQENYDFLESYKFLAVNCSSETLLEEIYEKLPP